MTGEPFRPAEPDSWWSRWYPTAFPEWWPDRESKPARATTAAELSALLRDLTSWEPILRPVWDGCRSGDPAVAWFPAGSTVRTHAAGSIPPNAWPAQRSDPPPRNPGTALA